MSAFELTEKLVGEVHSQEFALIVVNYANPNMISHTSNMKAAKKAVLAIDDCLAKVLNAVKGVNDAALIVTADHENVECMFDKK
ncbi:hypothetical protein GO684_03995 [Wolbachia endosymbiont of Litomosoides brasiliensis]|nr:hypothetical protein [Wolbachia endosymbiont of Litomosoides brasiliensis]